MSATISELVNQYRMLKQMLKELEPNLGIQLWLEWSKTPTSMNFSEPNFAGGVDKQLDALCPLLLEKGIDLLKLKEEFNRRSVSRLGCKEGCLYYLSGSPSEVSPRSIFNVIADLHRDGFTYLIMR